MIIEFHFSYKLYSNSEVPFFNTYSFVKSRWATSLIYYNTFLNTQHEILRVSMLAKECALVINTKQAYFYCSAHHNITKRQKETHKESLRPVNSLTLKNLNAYTISSIDI